MNEKDRELQDLWAGVADAEMHIEELINKIRDIEQKPDRYIVETTKLKVFQNIVIIDTKTNSVLCTLNPNYGYEDALALAHKLTKMLNVW